MRRTVCNLFMVFAVAILLVTLAKTPVMAKDVSNNFNKPKAIVVNKWYTGRFEKKNDTDCYRFKTMGGKYKVVLYDLSGRPLSKFGTVKTIGDFTYFSEKLNVGIDTTYTEYAFFSAAAGDRARYQPGAFHSFGFSPTETDSGYELWQVNAIGSHKKGRQVGISFKGDYKGKYKFMIVGKNTGKKQSLNKYNTAIAVTSPVTYTGKARKPAVKVKFLGTTLKKGRDYTVTYSKNINPGKAVVTIKGKGKYKGSVKTKFQIESDY